MSASTLWLLSIFSILSIAASIDDKCAACNAVALIFVSLDDLQAELEIQMSKEKPRNHLDMRHRLDSKGQRQGKVIDYRMSELRAVELLDGLCDNMQDYTLEKIDSSRREWIKVDNWGHFIVVVVVMGVGMTVANKQEARAYSKEISSYCGRLLEETEDELTELIKKGSVKQGDVSKLLCEDLSKHCSGSSDSDNDSGSDSDNNDEL
ncbi:hypothetical protein V6N13_118105 [Hibiscus sabdariffa]|uniref:DUF3456 domain-containing protein n=1 Tax=Hibiscus sabdariffa TaxID=183260 RepID=A0ABR2Q8S5_9ROSI